jgi:trehalose 6-phosphate phosphatase
MFLDFDGTLSEIVAIPSQARPIEGAPAALVELARRFAVVAVVSGRSAYQLLEWLGPQVEIWGVHGAERSIGGTVELAAVARPHLELMREVLDVAFREVSTMQMQGLEVEDKGVVIGLHYRRAPDRERARALLEDLAAMLVTKYGVRRGEGRMVIEVRPPIDLSKAQVVLDRARSAGLRAVGYVGDDRVDIPAFDALDRLEAEGINVARIAVASDEAPPVLIERADVVLDGPTEVLRLLQELA